MSKRLVRLWPLFLILCLVSELIFSTGRARAAESIHYRLAMPQPSNHFFGVSIAVDHVNTPSLDFQMPAWSPGRYVIYDFAHNVQEFRARGDQDAPLNFEKIDKQTWRVTTGG